MLNVWRIEAQCVGVCVGVLLSQCKCVVLVYSLCLGMLVMTFMCWCIDAQCLMCCFNSCNDAQCVGLLMPNVEYDAQSVDDLM